MASGSNNSKPIAAKHPVIDIDKCLFECPGGTIDVMNLIRKPKTSKNTFLYSNGNANGVVSDDSTSVLRRNHQRYLVYTVPRIVTRTLHDDGNMATVSVEINPIPRSYQTCAIAPIGPDGKTFVKEGVQYNLCALTDGSMWKEYSRNAKDNGMAMPAYTGRDQEYDSADDEAATLVEALHRRAQQGPPKAQVAIPSTVQRTKEVGNNHGTARLSTRGTVRASIPTTRPSNASKGPTLNTGASQPTGSSGEIPTPARASGKRVYTKRQIEPKRVSPYHVFLKLFMCTNAGQGPSFKDAAEVWRNLSKEQQAKYVATPSEYEEVQTKNFELVQNQNGILTREEHLTQEAVAEVCAKVPTVSASAIAIGSFAPTDTTALINDASPANSTVIIKRQRSRKNSTGKLTSVSIMTVGDTADPLCSAPPTQLGNGYTSDGLSPQKPREAHQKGSLVAASIVAEQTGEVDQPPKRHRSERKNKESRDSKKE